MENWIYLTPFQSSFFLEIGMVNADVGTWVLIRRGDKDKIEAELRTINLINSGIIASSDSASHCI